MIEIKLGPLDSALAKELAERRGQGIEEFISLLLHEEAAIEMAGWNVRENRVGDLPKDSKIITQDHEDV